MTFLYIFWGGKTAIVVDVDIVTIIIYILFPNFYTKLMNILTVLMSMTLIFNYYKYYKALNTHIPTWHECKIIDFCINDMASILASKVSQKSRNTTKQCAHKCGFENNTDAKKNTLICWYKANTGARQLNNNYEVTV